MMESEKKRPIVALTMGDVAGIGPEVIVKALAHKEVYEFCRPLVIGDLKVLKEVNKIVKTELQLHAVSSPTEGEYTFGTIDCLDMNLLSAIPPFGKVNVVCGDAAFRYIEKGVALALTQEVQAICTAPINKEALQLAKHDYPGHTEILADLADTDRFAMMFCSDELNVILATVHVGLLQSIRMLEPERVFQVICLAHEAMLRKDPHKKPSIAVCGLNPHAGENGLFGEGEEEDKIMPAISRAQEDGMDVTGPLPADTAFYLARRGDYDVVVAMNHDQGLGPVKVLGIDKSVNVTVGLPFVRTSVDHGTAFNIAGMGCADETNMVRALRQAALMSG